MDLNSVSYADLVAELERRKAISSSKKKDDDVMDILEPPTKVSQQAVADEKEKEKQEKIEQLKAELEFKEMELKVAKQQLAIEKEMDEMHKEHVALGNHCLGFMADCHRRNQATMTTEQLSLFDWFRH